MDAGQGDFDKLARQYWNAWGDMLRGAVPQPQAATPDPMKAWHDSVDWWTQLAHGQRTEVNAAVDRFNSQARGWYGAMQQVAAQFAGHDAAAKDIANAWKQALGAVGENPFPELFKSMRGQGQQGLDQWIEDASPFLDAWRREAGSWLGMPTFGFAREQQERWQKLAQAQLDLQHENSAYNALMVKSGQRAYEVFEEKLLSIGCKATGALDAIKAAGQDDKAAGKTCVAVRKDGKAVDIDGDYTETLARIASNKTGVGVFGLSFYENNADKLKVATVDGVTPSTETIAKGEYPVSRPLYFYVKKAHLGVVPGLKEYVDFFLDDQMVGPDSPLADNGQVAAPEAERKEQREAFDAGKTM